MIKKQAVIDNLLSRNSDCIAYNLAEIKQCCKSLRNTFPKVDLRFAMRACYEPLVHSVIATQGFGFSVFSVNEISLALKTGVAKDRILYNNPVKSSLDITRARDLGVDVFVTDSQEDLEMIAAFAPGSQVVCRMYRTGEGALRANSQSYGCNQELLICLLLKAKELGLKAIGISAHVGSQQMLIAPWRQLIIDMGEVIENAQDQGVDIQWANLGGGLPASGYLDKHNKPFTTDLRKIFSEIDDGMLYLRNKIGREIKFILEPGRYIVADYAVTCARVVRLSERIDNQGDSCFWLYISCSRHTILPDADSIQYRMAFPSQKKSQQFVYAVVVGSGYDNDLISNKFATVRIPKRLNPDDPVLIFSSGAYNKNCSGVNTSNTELLPSIFYEERYANRT